MHVIFYLGLDYIVIIINAWLNSTCYHPPPPGHTLGDLHFFLTWQSIPHPRARRTRQFPNVWFFRCDRALLPLSLNCILVAFINVNPI